MRLWIEVFVEWTPEQGEEPTADLILDEMIIAEAYTPWVIFGRSIEFTTVLMGMVSMGSGAALTWLGQRLAAWLDSRKKPDPPPLPSWKVR